MEATPGRNVDSGPRREWLEGLDMARVETANSLYELSAEVMRHCSSRTIACLVENPANSRYWRVPDVERLLGEEESWDARHLSCISRASARNTEVAAMAFQLFSH